jgi:subtilase family serine protease
MMPKRIEPSRLKAKYILGNWTSLSKYPDSEDILYEAIRDYCAWSHAENIRLTSTHLSKRYSLSEERVNELMQHLVSKGLATVAKSTDLRITYEITHNPYAE